MELLSMLGVPTLAILAVWAVWMSEEKKKMRLAICFSYFVSLLCGVIFIILVLESGSARSQFKDGVEYTLSQVFSGEDNTVLVSASPKNWANYYDYLIFCDLIMGGCPTEWPEKFKTTWNGEKYLIVALVEASPISQSEVQ